MKNNTDIIVKNSYQGITNISELKNNIQKNKPDFFPAITKAQNIVYDIVQDNICNKINFFETKIEKLRIVQAKLSKTTQPITAAEVEDNINTGLQRIEKLKSFVDNFDEFSILSEYVKKEYIAKLGNFKFIEQNIKNIEKLILPTQDIQDKEIQDMTLATILNLSKLTKYANQDLNIAQEKARLLKANLGEYSFYAIKKGLEYYIKHNEDYPQSLKKLKQYMEDYNEEGLILYVNIQFLMNLGEQEKQN